MDATTSVDAAIKDVKRLRQNLKRSKTVQVRALEERDLINATCMAWFNSYREHIVSTVDADLIEAVDDTFKWLLSAADISTSRAKYDTALKGLAKHLSSLKAHTVLPLEVFASTMDAAPNFALLVPDDAMQRILTRRWQECGTCVSAKAPLAATVMMGGLLEALLLARVHRESPKTRVFQASSAPRDRDTGKVLPLQSWTLRHYLDVGHELGWISSSAKDVGVVLRDYRNFIHPHKELSHAVQVSETDARLFWEISKSIARQLLS